MTASLKIMTEETTGTIEESTLAKDILVGLSSDKKFIPSKYFYDEKGSMLFNKITRHKDYYLTNCELEILENNKGKLATIFAEKPFNLIELGPGEGIKSRIIIDEFLQKNLDFNYFTIDISRKYLKQIVKQFNQELPKLKLMALNSDYFSGLHWLSLHSKRRNVVLFLGSSIGNFNVENTKVFLKNIWQDLHHDDYLLIGFDLRKDLDTLINAYNDSDGITRAFNMNLLQRLNRELAADFKIENFTHHATYNVYSGAMESYLISLKKQTVTFKALHKSFDFDEFEPIHVEFSYKYLLSQIEEFAQNAGFKIVNNFTDTHNYFVDSLWQVQKTDT